MATGARSYQFARVGMIAALLAILAITAAALHGGQASQALARGRSKELYQVKGLGAYFDTQTYTGPESEPYCSGFGTYVQANEQSQHQSGSGDKVISSYSYVNYGKWDYCDGPYTYEYASGYVPVQLSGNQHRVTVLGSVTLDRYNDLGEADTVVVDLAVSLDADGQSTYSGHSGYSNSGPGYVYRYHGTGTESTAYVSGAFLVEGANLLGSTPDYSAASILSQKSGQVTFVSY